MMKDNIFCMEELQRMKDGINDLEPEEKHALEVGIKAIAILDQLPEIISNVIMRITRSGEGMINNAD